MSGRIIDLSIQISSKPSENLAVFVTGFSEFLQDGLRQLYDVQIQNLLSRGYDVLLITLPSHTSIAEVCFSNPSSYYRGLYEKLEDIFNLNNKIPFTVIALSSAAPVLTHCLAHGASGFIKKKILVNPAFEFKKHLRYRLRLTLVGYYFSYLLVLALALLFWPALILLPLIYFFGRNLKLKKESVRKPELYDPCEGKNRYYPLIASALLLNMQRNAIRAVKKHALYRMPTLIFVGEKDPFFVFHYVQKLFGVDLGADVITVDGAGHSLLLTHWDEVQMEWNKFFPEVS